jgi:hypothetical protein
MDDTGIDVNDLIMAFGARAEAVAHNQECFAKMMGLRPEPREAIVAKCQLQFLRVAPISLFLFCDNGIKVYDLRYNSNILRGEDYGNG